MLVFFFFAPHPVVYSSHLLFLFFFSSFFTPSSNLFELRLRRFDYAEASTYFSLCYREHLLHNAKFN